MADKGKNTVIQIVIAPPGKTGRGVIVSGAPAGEMPIIKTGQFAQMQQLVGQVWRELATREPQVPDLTAKATAAKPVAKATGKGKAKSKPEAAPEAVAEVVAEPATNLDAEPSAVDELIEPPPTSDQLVANEHSDASAAMPAITPAVTPLEQAILDSKKYDVEVDADGTDNTDQD